MKKRWGWPTLPGTSEKGDPSGLFFFCLLSIRPYFTFDGGNVQFILSLSKHTNNRHTCGCGFAPYLRNAIRNIPNEYETFHRAAFGAALGIF